MEKEDRIAFSVISVLTAVILVGIMWLVRYAGIALFGWFSASDGAGLGFRDAFVYAIAVSTLLVVIFAIFAGDGVLGELPTMIIAFFLFIAFFTFSIAWIF